MSKSFDPGFYQDIAFADYLNDPAINNSGLKIFSQSPAKFAYWRNNDRPGTSAQIEGSALHCAILQPELFDAQYGKGPAPRVGSAGRVKWDQANPKAMPLSQSSWDKVRGMSEAFEHTSCTVAQDLLTGGTPELSIWWDDPATQLKCKIRIDYLKENSLIVDLKSTQNASPEGFLREIKKWGYQYQASWYMRGLNAAYRAADVNRRAEAFIFIAVESAPPYEIGIYMLAENIIEEASAQIDESLAKYKECLENGIYPGYPNQIIVLGEQGGELYG